MLCVQVVPVRWLAPEALLEEEHSMKSSVFSWAWLVWEVLTQAAIPHADLTDHQVREKHAPALHHQRSCVHFSICCKFYFHLFNPFCAVTRFHIHSGYYWEILYSFRKSCRD